MPAPEILTLAEMISLPVGSVVRCTNGDFTKVAPFEEGLRPEGQRLWQESGGTSVFGANVLRSFDPYFVSGPACATCDRGLGEGCACAACPACFDRVDTSNICEVCDQCSDCCGCVACEEGDHKVAQANLCDNCSKCDADAESHCECPVCSGCSEKSDGVCEECSQCSDCCDCNTCPGLPRGYGNTPRGHAGTVPDGGDWCGLCDRCFACCEHLGNCYTCSGCDERRSMDDGGTCSNCDECPDCCSNNGNCIDCEDCGAQSTDNQCGRCSEEGDVRCSDCCSGHEPEWEPLQERGEPTSTVPGLEKWSAEAAEIAEKAVSISGAGCKAEHINCRNNGGVSFYQRDRRQDMTAIDANSFKINKSHRFLTCEIETDHDAGFSTFISRVAEKWDMKIEHDGSIRGLEIITTPANGDAFVRQAEELCSALVVDQVVATRLGSSDTGFHLHVDARDLSWADLKRMFTLWSHVERAALDALRPERQATLSRWSKPRADTGEAAEGGFLDPRRTGGGEYAAKKKLIGALGGDEPSWTEEGEHTYLRTPSRARRGEKVTLTSGGAGEWAQDRRPSERYYALNGMSLFRLGTVEIRAFESTSNAEDLVCWGLLWAAFTDATKGMTREKMLKLIKQNPRTVLLDTAPSARVKTWLKRRWKLYAPAESDGARARRGLRPVKQAAPAQAPEPEVPTLRLSEINALPIGAMVIPAGTGNVYVKTEPSTWLNPYGDPIPSAVLHERYRGIQNAPQGYLYAGQLNVFPVGSIVEVVERGHVRRWTKVASGDWKDDSGSYGTYDARIVGSLGVRLVSMPWTPPATVQYRW